MRSFHPKSEALRGPTKSARYYLGMHVDANCQLATGALVEVAGSGLNSQVKIASQTSAEIPEATSRLFHRLKSGDRAGAAVLTVISLQLAKIESVIAEFVAQRAGISLTRVLAAGVEDPGFWHEDKRGRRSYTPICNPTHLAAESGVSIVDGFSATDLAYDGRGGPLHCIPLWLLAAAREQNVIHGSRLIVDVGPECQVTHLPQWNAIRAPDDLLSYRACPALNLLVPIAEQLNRGGRNDDGAGQLAASGKVVPELLAHWLAAEEVTGNWRPSPTDERSLLATGLRLAAKKEWALKDVLCTATHLISFAVEQGRRRYLGKDANVGELALTGSGKTNALIRRTLSDRFPKANVINLAKLSQSPEVIGATTAALLAMLHINRVPANHPKMTGCRTARILGRLTPGSPANWHRVVKEMAQIQPVMSLREAI